MLAGQGFATACRHLCQHSVLAQVCWHRRAVTDVLLGLTAGLIVVVVVVVVVVVAVGVVVVVVVFVVVVVAVGGCSSGGSGGGAVAASSTYAQDNQLKDYASSFYTNSLEHVVTFILFQQQQLFMDLLGVTDILPLLLFMMGFGYHGYERL